MKLLFLALSLSFGFAVSHSSSSPPAPTSEVVAQLGASASSGDDAQVCVRRVWFCDADWSQHASNAACAAACDGECFLDIVCLPGCFCE